MYYLPIILVFYERRLLVMKNKLLLTVTSLLLASALVACGTKSGGGNTPTPEPPTPEPPTPEPPAPTIADWPADFKPTVQALLEAFEWTDALPGIADGTEYDSYGGVDYGMFEIVVATDAESKVAPMLASYQENLLNANFTEIGEDEYGDMHYASPNGQYDVGPWSGLDAQSPGNFVVIDVAPYVAPVTEWPAEQIADIFEENDATLYDVPAFAAANATFKATTYLYYGIFPVAAQVDIIGVTADEITTYLGTTLPGANWEVAEDQGLATKVFESLEGVATIQFGQTSETAFSVLIPFGLSPIPSETWPTADVAAIVEGIAAGSETVVPACDGGTSYTVYKDSGTIYVVAEESLLATYAGVLTTASWTPVDGLQNTYDAPAEDIRIALSYDTEYGELAIKISAVPSWNQVAAEAAAIVEVLAPSSTTVIPGLPGGTRYSVWHDADYAAKNGEGEIDVYGVVADLLTAYTTILGTANWTPGAGENTFISPNEDILIELAKGSTWLEIYIRAYEKPTSVWPAESVAAALGEEVTDTLPAFEGECEGFNFLSDAYGTAVMVTVGEGNEEAAITAYQATLTTAGYTFNEEDQYYHSANDQIIVEVYEGTSGSITIAFMANPHTSEFPLNKVNAFLNEYDLGFTLTQGLPDASGDGYTLSIGSYYGYHYMVVTVNGNQLDSYVAALTPIVTGAGYELNEEYSDETFYDFVNEDEHEVQIEYNADDDTTDVVFFE